ncbi:MAG: YdjY domain-containing protein [Candidatus Binatia bacterium]
MIRLICAACLSIVLLCGTAQRRPAFASPTADAPLVVNTEKKEIQVFGRIYPARFNNMQGEQAHYHLMVWHGGSSPGALIETPADDLDFHAALVQIGAKPGNNLTMASWTERNNEHSHAPREKATGSALDVRLTWNGQVASIPIRDLFHAVNTSFLSPLFPREHSEPQSQALDPDPGPREVWRFGGNRDRLFNQVPFVQRPGCLVCLYSCPSGKISNAALSIHDYVTVPDRYVANRAILPDDGTAVIVTFHLHE